MGQPHSGAGSGPIHPWMRRSREVTPIRVQSVLDEPSLGTLVKGKARGGPCDGAKIEAPAGWDGLVRYKYGKSERLHPGRYKVEQIDEVWTWVWKEENPTKVRSAP